MNPQKVSFASDNLKLWGNLLLPKTGKRLPAVLFLHGAGHATKERFLDWQKILANSGIASFCFDFRGVGESEGRFHDGSLVNRLTDAEKALKRLASYDRVDLDRIAIAGNSMGAHIAVELTERRKGTRALLLTCAAAYSKAAEDQPLSEEFSRVIRQENSWQNSPVFTILEKFPGKLMVSYGEFDDAIPDGVKKKFAEICQRKQGKFLVLLGGKHTLLKPQSKMEEKARQQLFKESVRFLKENL